MQRSQPQSTQWLRRNRSFFRPLRIAEDSQMQQLLANPTISAFMQKNSRIGCCENKKIWIGVCQNHQFQNTRTGFYNCEGCDSKWVRIFEKSQKLFLVEL
jgi:hypothetical protein